MIAVWMRAVVPSLLTPGQVEKIAGVCARVEPKVRGEVEILAVGAARMRSLNLRYRGLNAPTDVLSFAGNEGPRLPGIPAGYLGQLYLCPPYIRRQAARFGVSPQEEYARLLAHGLLHLAGHDHRRPGEARVMFALQEKVVATSHKKEYFS